MRFRRMRTDILTHEKTAGIGCIGTHILLQCMCANMAGIMERSIRRMAELALVPDDAVEETLRLLESKGLIRWWPKLEMVWWIEMADEQAKGSKAWVHVWTKIEELPKVVREAFSERYGENAPAKCDRPSPVEHVDTPSDTPSDGAFPQEAGSRKQEAASGSRMGQAPDPVAADEPSMPPEPGRGVSGELQRISEEHRIAAARHPEGAARERVRAARVVLRGNARDNLVRELEQRGLDGVLAVLGWGWDEVAAARIEPKVVGLAFSKSGGWWDTLVAGRAKAIAARDPPTSAWTAPESVDGVALTAEERVTWERVARPYGREKALRDLQVSRKARASPVDIDPEAMARSVKRGAKGATA